MNYGSEFTNRAFICWVQKHGIRNLLIEPGKPMQNGSIEGFNGKFRDECLNEHWFETIEEARATAEAWRMDYNESRPHMAYDWVPPGEFAQRHKDLDDRQIGGGAESERPGNRERLKPSSPVTPSV